VLILPRLISYMLSQRQPKTRKRRNEISVLTWKGWKRKVHTRYFTYFKSYTNCFRWKK